ncbi:MAG: hypothetical protein JO306_13385 [Gemmatimonadetes bacterium]|nr:hypothetical protein [Gemmatimonadota bacterium]
MENSVVRPDREEPGLDPVRVRTPFRALAWVLGPFMLLGFGICLYETALAVLAGAWSDAVQALAISCAVAVGGGLYGWKILRAARTGLDPFSEDKARADAEHRAMLAALRATGEERPELPRPQRR